MPDPADRVWPGQSRARRPGSRSRGRRRRRATHSQRTVGLGVARHVDQTLGHDAPGVFNNFLGRCRGQVRSSWHGMPVASVNRSDLTTHRCGQIRRGARWLAQIADGLPCVAQRGARLCQRLIDDLERPRGAAAFQVRLGGLQLEDQAGQPLGQRVVQFARQSRTFCGQSQILDARGILGQLVMGDPSSSSSAWARRARRPAGVDTTKNTERARP